MLVDNSFTSNLPLITIDTGDQEPQKCAVWDEEKGYFVPTGEDPYIQGEISVINNSSDINSPVDNTQTNSYCKLKIRGNSSISYDKADG